MSIYRYNKNKSGWSYSSIDYDTAKGAILKEVLWVNEKNYLIYIKYLLDKREHLPKRTVKKHLNKNVKQNRYIRKRGLYKLSQKELNEYFIEQSNYRKSPFKSLRLFVDKCNQINISIVNSQK